MDIAPSSRHFSNRSDELGIRCLFEKVAARPGRKGFAHISGVVLHGEDEDLCTGRLLEHLGRRVDAALAGSEHHVHEHDVRLCCASLEERLARVARLANRLNVLLSVEQQAESRPHDRMIVHHEYADAQRTGTSTRRVVPAFGADSIRKRPLTSATRSRMPTRPSPPSPWPSSKPRPSSSITAVTAPSFSCKTMLTCSVCACLATFVRAS